MPRAASPVEDLDAGLHADEDAVSVLFVCLGNICRKEHPWFHVKEWVQTAFA